MISLVLSCISPKIFFSSIILVIFLVMLQNSICISFSVLVILLCSFQSVLLTDYIWISLLPSLVQNKIKLSWSKLSDLVITGNFVMHSSICFDCYPKSDDKRHRLKLPYWLQSKTKTFAIWLLQIKAHFYACWSSKMHELLFLSYFPE